MHPEAGKAAPSKPVGGPLRNGEVGMGTSALTPTGGQERDKQSTLNPDGRIKWSGAWCGPQTLTPRPSVLQVHEAAGSCLLLQLHLQLR